MKIRKKHTKNTDSIYELLREKEPEANRSIALIYLLIAGLFFIFWVVMQTGYYKINPELTHFALLGDGFLFLVVASICLLVKGKTRITKYLFITITLIASLLINMMTGFKVSLLYALPIIVSCRYFNKRLTQVTGALSAITTIAGAYINAYLLPQRFGLIDLNTVSYDRFTVLETDHSLYRAVLESPLNSKLIFTNTLSLTTLPSILVVLVTTFACLAVVKFGQQMIIEENARVKKQADMEIELEQDKQRMMMSQIQPHFLYNCLSTIMAVDDNPPETVEALGEFGKYLRENLDSLTADELIPFDKEMQHVRRYISLEQMRFKNNLNVDYDIKATGFKLPIMTVQMLAENAIKHGITKKEDGGTLKISTRELNNEYQIIIEDDGVGFDKSNIPTDSRSHVGLYNTKSRIEKLCDGTVDIESTIDVGTKITIHIPKETN